MYLGLSLLTKISREVAHNWVNHPTATLGGAEPAKKEFIFISTPDCTPTSAEENETYIAGCWNENSLNTDLQWHVC
jgi:hypothetical protein